MKLPISVFIITQNEEEYIGKVLESIKGIDEIVVVDSGSSDKTVEIAQQYGAKVVHQPWLGYAKQKQFAMSLCTHEWVLNLDGDEVVNPEFLQGLREIISTDNADSVRVWRNDIFIGKRLSKFSKKANNLRFYRKSLAHFDSSTLVHESATVSGKEIFANLEFDHYGYQTIKTVTDKNNQYSSLKALEKFKRGKSFSYVKLIFIFPLIFIKEYVFQRKVFSGTRGFILSILTAYYAFIKEAKLFELEQNSLETANKK
uniref:glycosyltransferase family 2 protein n=1 Tax=Ningiella ruwaisensis TaxID=2364274 RepID=UPI00109FBF8B|nr:glycosyltransferase family 2 protein [Ningiella ruwaisensis]